MVCHQKVCSSAQKRVVFPIKVYRSMRTRFWTFHAYITNPIFRKPNLPPPRPPSGASAPTGLRPAGGGCVGMTLPKNIANYIRSSLVQSRGFKMVTLACLHKSFFCGHHSLSNALRSTHILTSPSTIWYLNNYFDFNTVCPTVSLFIYSSPIFFRPINKCH